MHQAVSKPQVATQSTDSPGRDDLGSTRSNTSVSSDRAQALGHHLRTPTATGAAPIQRGGFGEHWQNLRKAWTGPQVGPLPSGPREDLDGHLRRQGVTQPFSYGLYRTNRGYGLNTNEALPQDKADSYKKLSSEVESGQRSNSSAFFSSSWDWAKRGHVPGATANLMGGMLSAMGEGVEADRKRKTGQD